MQYPCIRYERERADAKFAGNTLYLYKQRYQVTYINSDPDATSVFEQLVSLPLTAHERSFAGDNLNHDVFTTYF